MKQPIKDLIKKMPVFGTLARRAYWALLGGSAAYWEKRYSAGGDSGAGSFGPLAEFKAQVLNTFVADHRVQSVIEFGCGDGHQLGLAKYPRYLGFDVSSTAIAKCRERFGSDTTKSFRLLGDYRRDTADLTLSLDVIYHLVENETFDRYMRRLFEASRRYVIIYSSDSDATPHDEGTHVRHRKFTRWVHENQKGWTLAQHIPNRYPYRGDYRTGSFADFYIYEQGGTG